MRLILSCLCLRKYLLDGMSLVLYCCFDKLTKLVGSGLVSQARELFIATIKGFHVVQRSIVRFTQSCNSALVLSNFSRKISNH